MGIDFKYVELERGFEWTTDFNISSFKNKVLKLGPDGAPIIGTNHITEIGQPMGMFYGYITDGVFMNQAELDAGPIWAPGSSDRSHVGDVRFKDVSGPDGVPDGVINTYDKTIMGSPYPKAYFGMTNSFSYKNFGLSMPSKVPLAIRYLIAVMRSCIQEHVISNTREKLLGIGRTAG